MDRLTLSRIDEELGSLEVAALCFLCLDFVNKKRLEGIVDAKGLFLRLEEKGLLENPFFLSELLHTIRRADLVKLLQSDNRQLEETDANPILPSYRVMLYRLYEEMTIENLEQFKFSIGSTLGKRSTDISKTSLDLFIEMEKKGLLSSSQLGILRNALLPIDQELVSILNSYSEEMEQREHLPCAFQRINSQEKSSNTPGSALVSGKSFPQTNSLGEIVFPDAEAVPAHDPEEYYTLTHSPRGQCVIFNNEEFHALPKRKGTQKDVDSLKNVFNLLGFTVTVHKNLTANAMRDQIDELSGRDFRQDDALVVCVLSHGDLGSVFGIDDRKVLLQQVTQPFTSQNAPTLAGKPKMFFIQACQGKDFQMGFLPDSMEQCEQDNARQSQLQDDAGPVNSKTVASGADFLVGMATVPHCRSFRHVSTGSIYIQELCFQLEKSAKRSDMDDILSVLTRVNAKVSKGIYKGFKQMPEPKYTFTKKLVLKPV